jgi:hypothetical protein
MNEIFRFLFLRPPAPGAAVDVTPSPEFGKALAGAGSGTDRRAGLKAAASQFLASGHALDDLESLKLGDELLALQAKLLALDDPDQKAAADAVKDVFGKEPGAVAKSPDFASDRERLADNLIAAKLLSRDGRVEAKRIESLLRVIDLVRRLAAGDATLTEPDAIRRALSHPTLVVSELLAPPPKWGREPPPSREDEPHDGRLEDVRGRIAALEALSTELTRIPPKAFATPAAPPSRPVQSSAAPFEILRGRIVDRLRSGAPEHDRAPIRALVDELKSVESSTFEPIAAQPKQVRLMLTRHAADALPEHYRHTLRGLRVDLTETSVPAALSQIRSLSITLYAEADKLTKKKSGVSLFGSGFYDVGLIVGSLSPTWMGLPPSVPATHGTLKPVGVGDLLVVRQQLKRYEGGEVGHIENVLKGESKKREVTRSRTTEQTTITEVETKKDEERDTQTTERFELQREASTVIKEDSSFKAGLSLSGSYGPTVEFKASTDFAMSQAKEESSKTASTYSKEVTDRASTKVSERHREEQILRTLEVFEERNEHGVDNTAGAGHVIGVYQWVDKVYEAQVFNYGKRMMFDVMVPEPAAFWIFANSNKPQPGATLEEPEEFTLSPSKLTESNYGLYVQRYEVAGVKPPPEAYKTVSKTLEGSASHDDHGGTKVTELPLPDGYEAISAYACVPSSHWDDWATKWAIGVSIGKDFWARLPGDGVDNYFSLDNEIGSVPIGVFVFGIHYWLAAVEIDCQRTDRALEAWQLETHAAIEQAYLKLVQDYRDELAALQVQAANQIQGRNPNESRMIERAELKKQAVSAFTAQQYELFGAIESSAEGYPQPLLSEAEAEGRYIRFFEQAFEWEQMTYLFYPYFWGRKANWAVRALMQDVDPQFAEFLKAGAARIVVPVRPGFEPALAHFLDTGEIWDGADPPTLTSPLYVSIIDEIKERTDAPGTEIAQGDPWEVRLPTTLTRLRPDGSLPTWTKQPDGTWQAN